VRWIAILHRWIGLGAAVVLVIAALTGAILVFSDDSSVLQTHVRLLAGAQGEWVVTIATIAALILVLSGVLLWWRSPHFVMRRGRSLRAAVYDLHNLTGIYTSIFAFALAATGAFLALDRPLAMLFHVEPWRVPAAPHSKLRPHAVPLPIAALVARARRVSGGRITRVMPPSRAKSAVRFVVDGPELFRQRSIYFDQYSGAVLRVDDSRTAPIWYQSRVAMLAIHTGNFGIAGKALALLTTIAFAFIAITGALTWWLRVSAARKR
jgi:uncharacterized iron-regulated membrane protein